MDPIVSDYFVIFLIGLQLDLSQKKSLNTSTQAFSSVFPAQIVTSLSSCVGFSANLLSDSYDWIGWMHLKKGQEVKKSKPNSVQCIECSFKFNICYCYLANSRVVWKKLGDAVGKDLCF